MRRRRRSRGEGRTVEMAWSRQGRRRGCGRLSGIRGQATGSEAGSASATGMTADDTRGGAARRCNRAQQRDRRRRKANEVRRQLCHQGDDQEALVPKELSHRESAALDGAQAGENALHADRCVEQYGLSCASNGSRGCGAGGRWNRSRVAVSSWGLCTRPCPCQRAYDIDRNVNRRVTTRQTSQQRGGACSRRPRGSSSACPGTGHCSRSSRGG